ncbi:MAG TPA: sugar phosphate nucleotidyltransferase [Steroidobacteraceae bacterium]
MPEPGVWGLILAGGDGSRLRALTTKPCGTAVPKQFCSLHGGHSLLEEAILRGGRIVASERLCTIVADQHRQWWSECRLLAALPRENLIVQPRNRGTGVGVLYSLLHIIGRAPEARLVLLPSDHYVREEDVLRRSIIEALDRVERAPERPVLLGLTPDEADTELGYVLPEEVDPLGGYTVARFIEKPDLDVARRIVEAGAMWNTFILVGTARALLELYLPRYASLVRDLQVLLELGGSTGSPTATWPALVNLYGQLPDLDFSRDLLQGHEAALCVLKVPSCGWSDLGTPRRVGQTLRRLRAFEPIKPTPAPSAHINLAVQHAHFERAHLGATV